MPVLACGSLLATGNDEEATPGPTPAGTAGGGTTADAAPVVQGSVGIGCTQPPAATDLYAAPGVDGGLCTLASPCHINDALVRAKASGGTVNLAPGIYFGPFVPVPSNTRLVGGFDEPLRGSPDLHRRPRTQGLARARLDHSSSSRWRFTDSTTRRVSGVMYTDS